MLSDLQQVTLPLWASGDSSTKGGAGLAHLPAPSSANWEKYEKRASPVSRKSVGKVPGKRESLAVPSAWTKLGVMGQSVREDRSGRRAER